ncbi:DUF7344 domain-containing protein [Natrononativus amylolyticus]|uniref:DUF7344 domain-containing protein n=1 Tax=Natrononativus amylolyticus TaxID=2963434 RepID=UPI0020CC80B7|nr:hypothetical protein [Natrononativus amylolyticus]
MTGNDTFAVIADEHRRSVLQYLYTVDGGEATIDELVEYAAAAGSPSKNARLKILYHHSTLPRLDDAGYVEYDPRNRIVRRRKRPALNGVLDAIAEVQTAP